MKNDCPYNSGINCPEHGRSCPKCGWSPEGDLQRRGEQAEKPMEKLESAAPRKGGRCRPVAKINESGAVLELYPSVVQAAAANHMVTVVVRNHLLKKLKRPFKCTGGYTFRYADEGGMGNAVT